MTQVAVPVKKVAVRTPSQKQVTALKSASIKTLREPGLVGSASGQPEVVAMANKGKAWPLSSAQFEILVLMFSGAYVLFCQVEPLKSAWSLLLAQQSELLAALSEQAAELSRLRAVLSEVLTNVSGSVSATADARDNAVGMMHLLAEVKALFSYAAEVSERVFHTLGLLLITSMTGLFSWLDWSCIVVRDIATRVYSDPRGLLFNMLLLVCVGSLIGVTALACFLGSYIVQWFSPSALLAGGLHKHLWGWGLFLLGMLNPIRWVPFKGFGSGGAGSAPRAESGVPPAQADVPLLLNNLDASTALLKDRLTGIGMDLSASRLELPEQLSLLGAQGQASLDQAVEHLSLKADTGNLMVVREIAQDIILTAEVLRRTADLQVQAAHIEQIHSDRLGQVERVTSSLPDQLNRLELKLDDLSKETLVLKSLSLDSGSTIELTSKALRHLLKGKSARPVKCSDKEPIGPAQEPKGPAWEGSSGFSEAHWLRPRNSGPRRARYYLISASLSQAHWIRMGREQLSAVLNLVEQQRGYRFWLAEASLSQAYVHARAALAETAVLQARLLNEVNAPEVSAVRSTSGAATSSSSVLSSFQGLQNTT